jgi:hypothetical protein
VEDGTLRTSGAFGNRCPPGGTTKALRMAAASATARSRAVGEAAVRDAAVTGPVVVCAAAQPATAMTPQVARRSVLPGAHRRGSRIPLGRPAGRRGCAGS